MSEINLYHGDCMDLILKTNYSKQPNMILIKVSEFKTFFERSSHIKMRNIIAAFDAIKLECTTPGKATLTKASEGLFVTHEIEADWKEKQTVLLDEKILTVAVGGCHPGELLEITVNDKKVLISDGITPRHFQQINDPYPPIPEKPDKKVQGLSWDVMAAIGVAKKHAKTKVDASGAGPYDFVHTKRTESAETLLWGSSDAQIIYSKKFHKRLPELQLSMDACDALSRHEDAQMYRIENNWTMFECGATLYGFLDYDKRYVQVEVIIAKFDTAEKHFLINKRDLLSFCDSASQIHRGLSTLPPEIVLNPEGNTIRLVYANTAHECDQSRAIKAQVFAGTFETWRFNGDMAVQLLKSIPYENLIFSKAQNSYFITSEDEGAEDYVGLLNGLMVAQPQPKKEPVSDELPFKN